MDNFAAKPGVPNSFGLVQGNLYVIEPGKRPLSSMTPTIVTKNGKVFIVTGSPGGSTITTTVLQVMYAQTKNIVELKRHFRVSYQVILRRLSEMEAIDLSYETAKISAIYKQQNNGASLHEVMELPPELESKEFPENKRYEYLIWNTLKLGKISERKAAELLNLTVEQLRIRRREREFYALA